MSLFLDRLFRAAKLDADLYDEVVADMGAMNQAMMAVVIYSAAAAVGTFGRMGASGINIGMITTLIGWYIGAFFTYIAGARLFPEAQTKVDRKAVLRALGFASSPGLIRLLGLIPGLGGVAVLTATIWMIVAAVVAVKQALNYESTYRAVGVCMIGWIISAIVQGLLYVSLFSVFGVPAK
jgi:hypothetical protein